MTPGLLQTGNKIPWIHQEEDYIKTGLSLQITQSWNCSNKLVCISPASTGSPQRWSRRDNDSLQCMLSEMILDSVAFINIIGASVPGGMACCGYAGRQIKLLPASVSVL
jgi:hypothetical protein